MSLSADDLRRITRMVWSTQLGLDLEDADPAALKSRLDGCDSVLVTAYFCGEFSGRIEQKCSPLVSLTAAAAAFAATGKDVGTSDIRDTAAEMVHMTAGNLKALLSGSSEVSSSGPLQTEGDDERLVAEVGFTLDGEALVVSLIQAG